jgi:spoIIIJ-associated protein
VRSAEGSGRTVEEAIRDALRVLGVRREDVDLMVLDEGSRGVLGLGSRVARVRLTLLADMEEEETAETPAPAGPATAAPTAVPSVPAPITEAEAEELTELATAITTSMLEVMGFQASVSCRVEAGQVHLAVTGPDLAPLIGRHGQTLDALDLIVNLVVAHRRGRRVPLIVDVERYRARRTETLHEMARRFAERVRRSGRSLSMKPMPAAERRIVHTALAGDASVTTHSEGEEPERRIVISPRGGGTGSSAPGRSYGRSGSRTGYTRSSSRNSSSRHPSRS